MLAHEYATATAEQVHESALVVTGNFPAFYDAYRAWIKRGFAAANPDAGSAGRGAASSGRWAFVMPEG